ncbi:hypothetical protein [Salisediminibacterium beveridgei]|uniref:Uncharacterized protein n=1 Tax=Salisediminibacterium beveridgei TaxID=632773 RepID=A0A1D7QTT1_9BACI|nr:hypothetical protein [Salisediminibacterium beveridgei]AOM82421.1 hypothetical protein BBEV_1052 [Salisediminibacterium beveridgei]
MDIFTVPDPNDPMMGYAYIMLIFVLIAASFTVYKMKKSRKQQTDKPEPKAYDMYEYTKNEQSDKKKD